MALINCFASFVKRAKPELLYVIDMKGKKEVQKE